MNVTTVPCIFIGDTLSSLNHELLDCPSLCIAENMFTGKGFGCTVSKSDITLLNSDFNSNSPILVLALEPRIGIFIFFRKYICAAADKASCILQFPDTDRNGYQSLLTGCGNIAGLCERQMENLICRLIGISSFKSVSYYHVIQFPLAHAVKVQSCRNRLNILDIISNHIDIVQRAEKDTIQ